MATAQELMEQNPELSKAVTELGEQTLEEQVLAKLKEIEAILTKLDSVSIDLSVFLKQIQSFSDEKKEELQALVDKLDNPIGSKTITISTIDSHYTYAPIAYQEVWMKDGAITKYGSFFFKGFMDDFSLGTTEGANHIALPLPNDVEFDALWVAPYSFYARPKSGQSNVGGVSGSLDNYLFCLGAGNYGNLGNGRTDLMTSPYAHKFSSRVKKVVVFSSGDNDRYGAFSLLENGELYVAGYNGYGQLGTGNTTQVNSWTKTKDNVVNVFASSLAAFCVSGDTLYAAGWNGSGNLGVGDTAQKNSWTQVKTGISAPQDVVVSSNYEQHDRSDYASTLFLIDGLLYGSGYNSAYNIISQSTSQQNTIIRVTDGLGNPLNTPAGTKFVMHPLLTTILIPNGGNMDLYTGGNGVYGFGDSRSGNQKLAKVKTFEGDDWDILTNFSPCSYGDQIECFVIYSKKRQEAWAWGANNNGNIGVGILTVCRSIQQVKLPFKGSRFELQFQFSGGTDEGGLVCVIDDQLFACGYSGYGRLPVNSGLFSPISTK